MRPINFLRYPGGKSKVLDKIVPHILEMLGDRDDYCEPFVGGGSVALAVAFARPNIKMQLNDANSDVAAIWKLLSSGRYQSLMDAYLNTTPSVETFRKLQGSTSKAILDKALKFLALNRMAFSGKTHTSPVGKWDQTGKWKIDVEWRINHVTDNIRKAGEILSAHDVTVTSEDFRSVIRRGTIMYLDPPYYHRGPTMYPVSMGAADHLDLSEILNKLDKWVLSYDDCHEVRSLYSKCSIQPLTWMYSTGGATKGKELIIKKER